MTEDEGRKPVEVVIGTYEQYLIGYQVKGEANNLRFEQTFTNHAHSGSIRAVAASSELIASGGTDEVVRIFSGKKRTDVGTLVQQQGTISCIQFFEDSHMFTGSEDGTICVWDTRNWECLKTLRGHKSAVLSISIHPSGKMLLSVSRDRTLRTWNLIKGRCAYITNLKSVAHSVFWSPNGRDFVVAVEERLDVYNIAVGGVVSSFRFGKWISSIAFLTETAVAVGGDCDHVEIYDLAQKRSLIRFKAHENRIKSLFSTFPRIPDTTSTWLFSVSSDCHIKLWEVTELDQEPALLCSVDTTCRPTACSVMIPDGCMLSTPTSGASATPTSVLSSGPLLCSKLSQQENRKRRHSLKEGKNMEKKIKPSSCSPPKDLTNI